MAHRNFNPKSIYENQREITRAQPSSTDDKEPFSAGAFQDLDGYLVPRKGVHTLENYICHAWGLKTRGGSKRWTDTVLPALSGRTGYSLAKSGYNVIKTVGQDFSSSDVGNEIVFDDGAHERISAYVSTTTVQVESNTVRAASTAAWVHGPVNGEMYHEKAGIYLLHIDTRLFYSASINLPSWTEIAKSGIFPAPSSSNSRFKEFDDYALIYNANGIYKIDLTNFVYWQSNSPIPTSRIIDAGLTSVTKRCRRQTYTMSRLDGNGQNSDRFDSGVSIQQETGSVFPDSSNKDYGEAWTEKPLGPADTTYGLLIGATLSSPYDDITTWQAFSIVQFGITINGTTRNIVADLTGILSFEELANRIQIGLRDHFPTAECIIDTSGATKWFEISSPDEGGTVSVVTAGAGATDIGTSIMRCESGTGSATTPDYTEVKTVWFLEIPLDPTTSEHDAHFNRYSLYSTLDVGVNGVDPVSGKGNNGELFIWNTDIPVAKAFVASAALGVVTATEGEFVPGDVNAKIRFEDGSEQTITTYLSSIVVECTGNITKASQAVAIGGDTSEGKAIRVMTASQSGTTVTRASGDSFASSDAGRKIFWADGTESTVKSYTDADNVEVHESATIASTAACIHPKLRKWTDTVRDEAYSTSPNLRSRISNNKYILQTRFFTPLPDCNDGEVTGNMIWGVIRDENIVHYSQADSFFRHQAGYYYEEIQREIFQHPIVEISEVNDVLSVKCAKYTRGIDLNTFNSHVIEEAGTAIIKCTGSYEIDGDIGVKYFGGVCKAAGFGQIVITAEPGIRTFDGSGYSDDLSDGRIKKILDTLTVGYVCCYDPVRGFTFWGIDDSNYARKTNRSFTIAMKKPQGIFFSENTGDEWIWPNIGVEPIKLWDSYNRQHMVALDGNDGFPYDILQRDTVDFNGDTAYKVWKDKVALDGTGGTDIACKVKFGEDTGNYEHYWIRNAIFRLFVHAAEDRFKGASGYNSEGIPDDLEITIRAYIDGKLTAERTCADIPITGDVHFDDMVEGHRMAFEVETNMGIHTIAGRFLKYILTDKRIGTGVMTEDDYQEEFAAPTMWFSRRLPYTDRATGLELDDDTQDLITLEEGLDGESDSAWRFTENLTLPSVTIANGYIILWHRGLDSIYIGGSEITLTDYGTSGVWTLSYANIVSESGAVVISPYHSCAIFDLRLKTAQVLSAEAVAYNYDNIVNHDGDVMLP